MEYIAGALAVLLSFSTIVGLGVIIDDIRYKHPTTMLKNDVFCTVMFAIGAPIAIYLTVALHGAS